MSKALCSMSRDYHDRSVDSLSLFLHYFLHKLFTRLDNVDISLHSFRDSNGWLNRQLQLLFGYKFRES
jgi:hypothetical protein